MRGVLMEKVNISKLNDDEITMLFIESVNEAIHKNQVLGNPVCGFDEEKNKSFILYPNGEKVYAEA